MARSRIEGNKTLSKRETPRDIKEKRQQGENPRAKHSPKSGRHGHELDILIYSQSRTSRMKMVEESILWSENEN